MAVLLVGLATALLAWLASHGPRSAVTGIGVPMVLCLASGGVAYAAGRRGRHRRDSGTVARGHASQDVQQRSAWLATAAHELRNRLGALHGASEVLQIAGAAPATQARARLIVAQQVRELSLLASHLADLAETEPRERVAPPQDLAALAARVLESERATARAAGLQLSWQLQPANVACNAPRLERGLHALLRHALRQIPTGGAAVATLRAQAPHAVLALRPRATDAVASTATGDEAPRSLGLALARRIVDEHGGTLQFQDGGGLRLLLPLSQAPPPHGTRQPPQVQAQPVLLVGPPDGLRRTLAAALRGAGHRVTGHADATQALRCMLDEQPTAVIVDPGLPAQGLALALQARRQGFAGRMVAVGDACQHEAQALRHGFDVCLEDPVLTAELLTAIDGLSRGLAHHHQAEPVNA